MPKTLLASQLNIYDVKSKFYPQYIEDEKFFRNGLTTCHNLTDLEK